MNSAVFDIFIDMNEQQPFSYIEKSIKDNFGEYSYTNKSRTKKRYARFLRSDDLVMTIGTVKLANGMNVKLELTEFESDLLADDLEEIAMEAAIASDDDDDIASDGIFMGI